MPAGGVLLLDGGTVGFMQDSFPEGGACSPLQLALLCLSRSLYHDPFINVEASALIMQCIYYHYV